MEKSNFFTLNWKDFLKGFIMAIIGAFVAGVYQAINTGAIEFTWLFWRPIVFTSIGAGLTYLLKNLFTNSQDKFLQGENK